MMGKMSDSTFKKLNRYVNVRLQQGVPILDADWNEQDDIRKYELQAFLKWFVGNGVPQGSDAFKIKVCNPAANDFEIVGSSQSEADKKDDMRCLVDGWEVFNQATTTYEQMRKKTNLVTLPELTSNGVRTDIVYLDIWERVVTNDEGKFAVNEEIGQETCTRIKREWVVLVAENCTIAKFEETAKEKTQSLFSANQKIKNTSHVYYVLALLKRTGNTIAEAQIIDLRTTCGVLSQTVEKDGKVDGYTLAPRMLATKNEQELTALRIKPEFKDNEFKDNTTKYGLVVEDGDVKIKGSATVKSLTVNDTLTVSGQSVNMANLVLKEDIKTSLKTQQLTVNDVMTVTSQSVNITGNLLLNGTNINRVYAKKGKLVGTAMSLINQNQVMEMWNKAEGNHDITKMITGILAKLTSDEHGLTAKALSYLLGLLQSIPNRLFFPIRVLLSEEPNLEQLKMNEKFGPGGWKETSIPIQVVVQQLWTSPKTNEEEWQMEGWHWVEESWLPSMGRFHPYVMITYIVPAHLSNMITDEKPKCCSFLCGYDYLCYKDGDFNGVKKPKCLSQSTHQWQLNDKKCVWLKGREFGLHHELITEIMTILVT
jgi:hypothetical protein